jgi:hypothetical protein
MYTKRDLENLGYDPTQIESFDPTGAIVDEKNPGQRGKFKSQGIGKDAIFTLRLKNNTASQKKVELFNPIAGITNISNDSQYANYGAYQPFTASSIINKMSAIAIGAEGGGAGQESAIAFGAIAIFNDLNGDLCYLPTFTTAQYAAAPLLATNTIADAYVRCNQVPYKRFLADLQDLVLDIRRTKMQFSSDAQLYNPIDFQRIKTFGGAESNTLEPSEFFNPENNQDRVINIDRQYYVDKQTALYIILEPNEDMLMTFFCKMYRNNGIVIG